MEFCTSRVSAECSESPACDLFQKLAALVPGVIYQYRLYPDGRSAFPYSSPGMFGIYERTPEEVREDASPVFSRLHPDDYDMVARAIQESATTLEVFICEFRVVLPKQGLRWRWSQAHPERTPDGGTLWHGMIVDITERKLMEEALWQNQKRLLESQRLARLGSWSSELSSPAMAWSEEAYRVWGVSPDTFMPTKDAILAMIHPDDCERFKEWTAAVERGENPADLDFRCVRRDGSLRFLRRRGVLVRDERGTPVRVSGTIQDITELTQAEAARIRAEQQFHHAQKMESVGRLAGGIAHDFNNLLTVINGYCQLLLPRVSGDEMIRGTVGEILKAGERAAGLTRQLLAFSRKDHVEARPVNLNRLIQEMQSMIGRLVGESVDVRVLLNAKTSTVYGDRHQLEQVLMNLVVNSRDAMPRGGELSIETASVYRDAGLRGAGSNRPRIAYVVLSVRDDGEGIDPEIQQRMFEPFFTTKKSGEGTGLGLSVVQGVVAQAGGDIEVESAPGRGTTIRIFLPALSGDAGDELAPTARTALRGREAVLVVEDRAEVAEYIVMTLKEHGYRVTKASNAGEALLLCESGPVDLLLTDVVMPHVSGLELANRLRRNRPEIKVLFMSGYPDDILAQHGGLAGDMELLHKPFAPGELATRVRAVLDGKKP